MFLGNTRQEMKELVTKIKDFSELGPWFHRSMLTYSSGMRARLGFSTALHIKGDIILVDEVLGVGDGAFQEKSSKAMQAMMESERTVVLVTHSPGKIADVCNNALWLDEGEAVMYGDAAQVSSAYSDFTKLYRNLHSDLQPQNKVSNAEIARVAIREVLGEEYKNEVCAG